MDERVSLVDLASWEHEARDHRGRWTGHKVHLLPDVTSDDFMDTMFPPGRHKPSPTDELLTHGLADADFRSVVPADKMPKGWKLITPTELGKSFDFIPSEVIQSLYKTQASGQTAVLMKGPHNHVVAIDPVCALWAAHNPEWVPGFLAKASQALEIAQPALGSKPVLVHMDQNFYVPGMPEGGVLAYVNNGDGDMLTVNPQLLDPTWGKSDQKPGEWFPMAFENYPLPVAVMVHEMGHIVDNRHRDTAGRTPSGRTPSGTAASKPANFFWRTQYPQADKAGGDAYGQTSAFEGYAESFAQYMLTKATMAKAHHARLPMSGMAAVQQKRAEAFAKKYGWDRSTK